MLMKSMSLIKSGCNASTYRAFGTAYYSQPSMKLHQIDLERQADGKRVLNIPYEAFTLHVDVDLKQGEQSLGQLRDKIVQ